MSAQADGTQGQDILNEVGADQNQQQCKSVFHRATLEVSLPEPANDGPVDQDGATEVGQPSSVGPEAGKLAKRPRLFDPVQHASR
jgi:hypothetical protein